MDRAGFVEALRAKLAEQGLSMIPGTTDQWGSRIFYRRRGEDVVTARLEFSSHFHQATTFSLWLGPTLWAVRIAEPRIGGFLTESEQSERGVRTPRDHGDAWWSGYSQATARGMADAVALAVPRLVAARPARDIAAEEELLRDLRAVAERVSTRGGASFDAASPPEEWIAAADAQNMSGYRGRISEKSRAKWARDTARDAWQHRQAGLI